MIAGLFLSSLLHTLKKIESWWAVGSKAMRLREREEEEEEDPLHEGSNLNNGGSKYSCLRKRG